ncbi:MAG: O-methyltransferase [Solirubrobacterales bacterium]
MSGPTAAPGGEAPGFEPAAAPGEAPAPPPRGPHEPGRRAGRHHTARGPMGLSGWLRLPAALLRARLGRVPERPWIVPAAVGWLGRRAHRDWRVLELGSGRSTVWLAQRTGSVLSFEDNEHWLARARELLGAAGIENAEVRHLPVEYLAAEVEAMSDESFDLVVVDFLESPGADRVSAVRAARDKVRPGGYLLLDDSDRPGYAGAWELLGGWRERRFSGVKDEWPEACETAIFQRPQD